MKDDPKQIVTPYAFEVHPDLLGLPLATPKRRLLALFIDLIVAAILSSLGNMILALATTGVFVWIAVRTQNEVKWQNYLRYTGAAIASIFVFGISYGLFEAEGDSSSINTNDMVVSENIDWTEFAEKMSSTDFNDPNDVAALETYAEQMGENALSETDTEIVATSYDEGSIRTVNTWLESIQDGDSTATDSLRALVAANVAAPELSDLETQNEIFAERIDDLEDENEDLQEELENPGFLKTLRAAGEDFGLTFGWMGVYFILSLALFQGRTAGKKLLGLKVVRLNNKPIGIWYSFERFGGYAAGVATGLLGFFQIFWDANRQGIHDKIASTVVIDLRDKKKRKFKDLTEKVLQQENLLSDE